MITVKDQVSRLFGAEVADVLANAGLLRAEPLRATVGHTTATHWRVQAWTSDALKADWYNIPSSLRNELKSGLRSKGFAEWLTDNKKSAQRYATMVTNAGMNSRITAMVLTEVIYPDHAPSTALANYRAGHEVWDWLKLTQLGSLTFKPRESRTEP